MLLLSTMEATWTPSILDLDDLSHSQAEEQKFELRSRLVRIAVVVALLALIDGAEMLATFEASVDVVDFRRFVHDEDVVLLVSVVVEYDVDMADWKRLVANWDSLSSTTFETNFQLVYKDRPL